MTDLLLLGEKMSDDLYSNADINMLQTISSEAASALKNTKLYEELENKIVELQRSYENTQRMNIQLQEEITQREFAEQALQKAHTELEDRVRERTGELDRANRQLQMEIEEKRK
ncbi:hypothetical protein ACFL6N_07860, partial [Thermodesulfobacteriota bacterium]